MLRPGPPDQPMPPERFDELLRERAGRPAPPALHPVPRREPAAVTDPLAAELLAEAAERPLESGELLLVSEDAVLADLEAAAASMATAGALPDPAGDAALTALAAPRLLSPRLFDVFGWTPPLVEHLRMLEAALRGGMTVTQTMLVGHVETFPERVEHLMRLRSLLEIAAGTGGGIVLRGELAGPATLPDDGPQMATILADARPSVPDTDVRHARAVARLALGPGVVVAD